jgi:hypothetical protein
MPWAKMNNLKFKYYQDPGHGWVAVKRELVEKLGLKFTISHYSYQKGKTVYLEEDCDAHLLVDALKQRGMRVELIDKHTNLRSPIRSYEPYRP